MDHRMPELEGPQYLAHPWKWHSHIVIWYENPQFYGPSRSYSLSISGTPNQGLKQTDRCAGGRIMVCRPIHGNVVVEGEQEAWWWLVCEHSSLQLRPAVLPLCPLLFLLPLLGTSLALLPSSFSSTTGRKLWDREEGQETGWRHHPGTALCTALFLGLTGAEPGAGFLYLFRLSALFVSSF